MEKRIIKNLEDMHSFAEEIAEDVKGGEVLLLSGPLGAGKTTFVQGLAKALGVEGRVTSPSYTVVGEYAIPQHVSLKRLVHVDLYRLPEAAAAKDPAVLDMLEDIYQPDRLTVIEWAERLGAAVPQGAILISFAYGQSENERIVKVETRNYHRRSGIPQGGRN